MRGKGCTGFMAIAVLTTCVMDAAAGSGKQPDACIRFHRSAGPRIIVPVRVNGEGPFRFVLDTGAAVTAIDEKLARELDLRPITRIRLTHFMGSSQIPLAPLKSLSVGEYTVPDVKIIYCKLQELWGFDGSTQGVLGQDFLSRFNYLLNLRERMIEFERKGELRSRLGGEEIHCDRSHGKFYVRVPSAAREGCHLRFLLDSGSPYILIYETPHTRQDLKVVRYEQPTVAQTANGRRKMQVWRVAILKLGEVTLRNLRVRVIEPMEKENLYRSGILPVNLFEAIYFNSKESYVILNPGVAPSEL